MKSKSYLSFILIVIAMTQAQAFPAAANARLLVKWNDGPSSLAANRGNARIGSTVERNFHALGWQLVELPPELTATDGIKAYEALETVSAVEANRALRVEP